MTEIKFNLHLFIVQSTGKNACIEKKMGEFGGQNAHSTLNTDCESGV